MGGFSMSILLLAMAGMFWAFVIAIVILAIIKLALYVFESFGLMKLNKNLGYKHSWTAWIPIYNKYLLGKIAVKPWAGVTLSLLWLIKTVLFILGYIFAGMGMGVDIRRLPMGCPAGMADAADAFWLSYRSHLLFQIGQTALGFYNFDPILGKDGHTG